MSGNSNDEEKRLALYFQPGQVMFHVTGTATEESIKKLLNKANELAKSKGLNISEEEYRKQDYPPSEKYNDQQFETESGGKKRGSFSLIYADITKENGEKLGYQQENPNLLLDNLDLLQDDLNSQLELIFLLDDELTKSSDKSLQVVSPNWLIGGSPSDPGGTGGPGGRPSPYDESSDNAEYKFHFSKSFLQQYSNYFDPECNEHVVVVILDTVPDLSKLDQSFEKWGKNNKHPLISRMLNPDNRLLKVHFDSRVSAPPISDLSYLDHDYEMNDHGLFVAGIIHSLAPQAELHLFQVLNRYGVGDLEIIGETLANVFSQFKDRHLVVNLSLNYSIPLDRAHTKIGKTHTKLGKKLVPDIFSEKFLETKESWLKRAAKPAELMCDMFYDRQSGIIAAAGNDWDDQEPGSPRPKARYPAAFDHVVGVGALTRTFKAAKYSNLADKPPKDGITTLGGEEGAENGILGTYIGEFPDGSLNENGWAWWCGTSFATPIISGLVAAAFSCMLAENSNTTTQDAIDIVFAAQKEFTEPGEDEFLVTQGTS